MGKLNWASQVICGGRAFLRRVLDLKNSVKERHHKVLLTNDFFADLQWWLLFIKVFNGTCRIQEPRPISSLQSSKLTPLLKEVEVITMETIFYVNWALDLPDCASEQINVKEFVAIFLAVFRSSNNFLYKKVVIYSDNASGVSWIKKGTSRTPLIQFMCRFLFWLSAMYNCAFIAQYLPGKQTILQMHGPVFPSLDNLLNFIHVCLHCNMTLFQSQNCCLTGHYHLFLLGGFTVQSLRDQSSDLKRKAWANSTATTCRNTLHFQNNSFNKNSKRGQSVGSY